MLAKVKITKSLLLEGCVLVEETVQAVCDEKSKHGTRIKGWWNTVNKITVREPKALKHQLC